MFLLTAAVADRILRRTLMGYKSFILPLFYRKISLHFSENINPFRPSGPIWHVQPKFRLQFNSRRDHQKTPYERRDYESVDEKSLS